jgi:aryl-alcohol dehydrogenase-like predicted oxidoreductase
VHFALSQNVSVALVGCDSVQQLEDNVEAARRFVPMSDADQRALVERLEPDAHSLLYYKR